MIDPIGATPGGRVFLDDTTNDLEDAYRALSGLGSPPQPDLHGLDKSQAATLSVLAWEHETPVIQQWNDQPG